MITTLQNAVKKLMLLKASADTSTANEIESIIQDVISGEQMLSTRIEEAEELIAEGIEIMGIEQVCQWQGVRAWQDGA